MNAVSLIGRLTKDVELRYTQSKKAVASFNLAVRGRNETDFIPCTAWDKQAEVLEKYCAKGSMIGITGRLKVESYEKDGRKRSEMRVIASDIDLLGSKEKGFTPTSEPDPFQDEGEQEGLPF